MKKKISTIIIRIILLLSSILLVATSYYVTNYPTQEFDQILYYLLNGVERTAPKILSDIIWDNIFPVLILFIVLLVFTVKNVKNRVYLKLKVGHKKTTIQLFPIKFTSNHRVIYTIIVFILSIIIFIHGFKIDTFVIHSVQTTSLYETHYVDGRNVEITFPEKKRNLILIVLESMETTLCSRENGGGWEYSIIPELENLALENISFSNTNKLGGARQYFGTNFTSGGLLAETAGINLITAATLQDVHEYYGNGRYFENAFTLGDILKEQGYNLEFITGTDGSFGGRKQYFMSNGDYKIFDVNYAIETGKMRESEKVWWGFEDDKLFTWAKEEIIDLAGQNKPFNIIIETADTHFTDGYLSKYAENKYPTQYENVHAYSSKLTSEFVKWIQEQDFYENTTIVILGDHLGKQEEWYESHTEDDYDRRVYNVIINSAIPEANTKNRQFSTMDFFPTILASMGVTIEGNRLGLGTNLFSNTRTLTEELGFKYIDIELRKKSEFYNEQILGKEEYESIKETMDDK